MKLITALALVGLLAACNAGATTPSEQPLPTVGSSDMAASDTASASAATAMTCTDAVAGVDMTAIASTTDLMTLGDELDGTISSCGDVSEWTTTVQTALPDLDVSQAEAFLQARCAENATLATTPICTEVGV
ncbi:MAG TPA: hypothetical protein VFK61_07370 [Candidatus Limnocylindria bacterium]|jgi:hypothetical protein|nr:hypothetical protein [Candidatus Limnocylindria bacterium]